jgi:hypothetical protein
VWRFEQEGNGWKRTNLDLWCRHEEHQGWVIVDADGQLIGRPLAPSQASDGQRDLYDLAFIDDNGPS